MSYMKNILAGATAIAQRWKDSCNSCGTYAP